MDEAGAQASIMAKLKKNMGSFGVCFFFFLFKYVFVVDIQVPNAHACTCGCVCLFVCRE